MPIDPSSMSSREPPQGRMSTFFVPGTGIDREVITTDICRYLGNDALVKPGPYTEPRTNETINGYFVTAYRALTTEQIADLKADSSRWLSERSKAAPSKGSAQGGDGYRQSVTRARQQGQGDLRQPPREREPSYGNQIPPQGQVQQFNPDRYGNQPQPVQTHPGYTGSPDVYAPAPNYPYGTTPGYGAAPREVVTPRGVTYPQPPVSNYPPPDGRGQPVQYPQRQLEPQYVYGNQGQPMGRGQPVSNQQYPRMEAPPNTFYGRGPSYDGPGGYYNNNADINMEEETEQMQMDRPPPNTGVPRQREREPERSDRHRESKHRRR